MAKTSFHCSDAASMYRHESLRSCPSTVTRLISSLLSILPFVCKVATASLATLANALTGRAACVAQRIRR
eukprot:6185984-Pleurochrysis_carterae.AAC.3